MRTNASAQGGNGVCSLRPVPRLCYALAGLLLSLPTTLPAQIKSDEIVVFFPTTGRLADDQRTWILPIHGWIGEPEERSAWRGATLGLFAHAFGIADDDAQTATFMERARWFLVDNERGKDIHILMGGKEFRIGTSEPNGHFEGEARASVEEVEAWRRAGVNGRESLSFCAVMPKGSARTFAGKVHLLEATGVSVISDIDDTIKISHVTDPHALLRSTFVEPYEAVPGMAEVYRRWVAAGAGFHYVSASPWQLYPPLSAFLHAAGFPEGSFHMQLFRWKDSISANLFESPEAMKLEAIEPILNAFPRRRFVFVGDSGQRDPEVYGSFARRYPEQVVRVLIRNVTSERADSERFANAFDGVPRERWMLFTDAREIPSPLWPAP